jgi:dihydroorotate dehydrogenase
LSSFRRLLPRSFPIIGVGGITDEGSARQMIEAGADLLQIYTGFVLKGTKLVHKINKI